MVLDKDERILKYYKPSKKRFFIFGIISTIPILLIGGVMIMFALFGFNQIVKFSNEYGEVDMTGPRFMLIFSCIWIAIPLLGIFFSFFRYGKLGYAVTNKRVMISHGTIGIDFKSIPLDKVITVDVNVNPFDKLCHPKTGSLIFGSSVISVGGNGNVNSALFVFRYIANPYDAYREVKEILDDPDIRNPRY